MATTYNYFQIGGFFFKAQIQTNPVSTGYCKVMGQDSAVGIVTRYGLHGPGIESQWRGVKFSAPIQTGPEAYPASYTMGTGSFLGVKWPGRGIDLPPPSSTEVKERLELYLYSPCGPLTPVLG
jgi:hypothetical protein